MTEPLRTRRRRTPVLLVGLLVLAAALALTVGVVRPWSTSSAAASSSSALPFTATGARVARAAQVTPLARPADALPHDPVAAAAPTSFHFAGPGIDITAKVCGMDFVRPLDPPGDQYHTVCWVQQDWGVAPGTAGAGTTYVLGHSWAKAPLVLTPVSVAAMNAIDLGAPVDNGGVPTYPTTALNGSTIQLTTPAGVLAYRVSDTYAVAKTQAGDIGSLMDGSVPNRLVLITCGVHDGQDVDVNIVLTATLVSSRAA